MDRLPAWSVYGSHNAAEWQGRGSECLGLLADEESRLAGRLNGGLLDRGDGGVEVVGAPRGDRDEAGVAQDAVPRGEIGFLLENVLKFGGLRGILYLADALTLSCV